MRFPHLVTILVFASIARVASADAPNKPQGTVNPDGSISYLVGNGSITLESGDPGAVYQEMQKLFVKSGINVSGYNLNQVPNTSFKTISIQISPNATQASDLMKQLSKLGETKSESYNEGRRIVFPPDVIEAELKGLKRQLDKLTAPARPDFETLRALVGKIVEAEGKLRNARYSGNQSENLSRISITIQSKGLVDFQAKERKRAELMQQRMFKGQDGALGFSDKYLTTTSLTVFVPAFLLGGLFGWFFTKRRLKAKM